LFAFLNHNIHSHAEKRPQLAPQMSDKIYDDDNNNNNNPLSLKLLSRIHLGFPNCLLLSRRSTKVPYIVLIFAVICAFPLLTSLIWKA